MKKLKYNGEYIVGASLFMEKGKYYKVDKNKDGIYQVHLKIREDDECTSVMTLYKHEYEDCFEH